MKSVKRTQESQGEVRAVKRALEILAALAAPGSGGGLSVLALQERTGLSRPTLYRLLATLARQGFVAAAGEPQQFRLGPAIARLVHGWNAAQDVGSVAEPIMRRVWKETGETVALFVPQGELRVCIAELPSAQPLSFKRGVGYRERLVLGASGRAILAQRPAKRYSAQLREVRARGFAVSRDELIKGAVAVAAPFFDSAGAVAGSLGIFGPGVRLTGPQVERFGGLLVREARELSMALGSARE
jgi:IclR family transcriptional regulator, acetate operon repressor